MLLLSLLVSLLFRFPFFFLSFLFKKEVFVFFLVLGYQVTLLLEKEDDVVNGLANGDGAGVDGEGGLQWWFIGIVDASEVLQDTLSCLSVESLSVSLFADIERSGNVDFDEASMFRNDSSGVVASVSVGGNSGSNSNTTSLGDLARDVRDASDVDFTMLLREAEFAGEVLSDFISIKKSDSSAAFLHESDANSVGDRRFARSRQSSEEQSKTLL